MRGIEQIGLVDDEDIALDDAALALAALDHLDADLAEHRSRISRLSARLAIFAAAAVTPAAQARLLARVIADENGMVGDSDQYDDPANADLMKLLDRRRGLPVTLSILYVALARRAGWAADPLNVPGHVLVRLGREPLSVIIDPFDGGRILDAAALEALLTRFAGRHARVEAGHLAPLSNRAVLVRLLTNQATRASRSGDTARALELYERMTSIAPGFTGLWWERARLEQLAGHATEARASLLAMMETTRDTLLTARIRTALTALARTTP